MSNKLLAAPKAKLADLPDDDELDDELAWRTFDGSSTATVDALEPVDLDESNAQDMYERNLDLYNESIVERPLVDVIIPISELRDEYQNAKFIEQLNWLADHGFQSIRRTRGDGDCFYRSFGFAFVEHLLHASDIKTAVHRAIKVLDATLPLLDAAGFDKISYEDSHSIFKDLIQDIAGGADGQHITVESILAYFQDFYNSNTIVYYLRLATAAQIQLAPDDYAPFLTNQDIPNSEDILAPEDFNAKFVIPLGKEADDVQISALCRVFQVNVDIAYVDGREDNRDSAQKVRLVPFRSDVDKNAEPITLLYRQDQVITISLLEGIKHDRYN